MKTERIRSLIFDIAKSSETIKKSITVEKREKLLESILNLSDEKIIKLFERLSIRRIKRNVDKVAIFSVAIPVPGSTTLYGIYKFVTDVNYKCAANCRGDEQDKQLCYKKCNVASIELAIQKVKRELKDCWYHKNPKKCEKRTINYLKDLYETLGKAREKLSDYNYKILAKQNRTK